MLTGSKDKQKSSVSELKEDKMVVLTCGQRCGIQAPRPATSYEEEFDEIDGMVPTTADIQS